MGGDLNSKKSWHPHTIKNQKRVWQAEKANAVEKQKFQELQHEISSEKARDELISMGKASGVLKDNSSGCNRLVDSIIDNKKLEWMYKSPADLLNREEYLLGRAIDRNFEEHAAGEKQQQKQLIGVTVPKNHVEHECIPFSIRSFRGNQISEEQVDLQRKMMEDPLMAIRQKEIETRRKILENPVKLKELHRLLHNEKELKQSKSKKKSKKDKAHREDPKSSKRKHHKSKRNTVSTDTNNPNTDDLDVLIAKKYQNLKTSLTNDYLDADNKAYNLSELLNKKYNTLTTELDNVRNLNRNKKKHKKISKEIDEDDSDDRSKSYRKSTSNNGKNHDTYSNSNESKRYSNSDYSMDRKSREYTKESSSKRRSSTPQETESHVKSKHRKTSSTNSSDVDHDYDDSDNSGNNVKHKKPYGLVTSDGKKLELKNVHDRNQKSFTSSSSTFSNRKPSAQWKRPERKQLSEAEKTERFKEMQQNVEWRDLEREKTIRKYREEQHQTDINEKLHTQKFDKDFLNKELHKALSSQNSVESRIKSKINNIQRSGSSMDSNFAKR